MEHRLNAVHAADIFLNQLITYWTPSMKFKVALAAVVAALSLHAEASNFPQKAITIITPFPAGSSSDMIPRLLAPIVSQSLGVPVIVDNRPGANGSLGAYSVATSPADGHTLLLATTGVLAINQWIYAKPRYLPERDFAPITNAASTPNILVAHPSVPANNLKELVALAKSAPGKYNYASAGNGSTSHLCGELLRGAGGIDLVHVPYRGPAPAMQDVLAGQVSIMCDNFSNVVTHVQSGKLKAIAITDTQRSKLLPNVPTTAEQGFPTVQAGIWYGFVAPSATDSVVVNKLNKAFADALKSPAIVERLSGLGLTTIADTPDAFKQTIAAESARMKKVVVDSGIKLD